MHTAQCRRKSCPTTRDDGQSGATKGGGVPVGSEKDGPLRPSDQMALPLIVAVAQFTIKIGKKSKLRRKESGAHHVGGRKEGQQLVDQLMTRGV